MRMNLGKLLEQVNEESVDVRERSTIQVIELSKEGKQNLIKLKENLEKELIILKGMKRND